MRKILFFIILIPFFAALGHDIYIYTQDQRKGFRLSDIGAIWSKYHKESHDQWKIKVGEVEDVVGDLTPDITIPNILNQETQTPENIEQPAYAESFTQTSEENKESIVTPLQVKNTAKQASSTQEAIGFILEQTAIFVFGALAAFIFIMNFILSFIFGGRVGKGEGSSTGKKGGNYKYGRK